MLVIFIILSAMYWQSAVVVSFNGHLMKWYIINKIWTCDNSQCVNWIVICDIELPCYFERVLLECALAALLNGKLFVQTLWSLVTKFFLKHGWAYPWFTLSTPESDIDISSSLGLTSGLCSSNLYLIPEPK